MASLSTDKRGNRTIQFFGVDGKRRSVRLGPMPKKAAGSIRDRVQALVMYAIAHTAWDNDTAGWVAGLAESDSKLYEKLAAVGLLPKRTVVKRATLAAFVDEYLANRTDIKPSTRSNLMQVRNELVEHFGPSKPMADVSEGDADQFRIQLRSRLSENTTRRHCARARQFFQSAVKHRLIRENPFGEMKELSVQANSKRMHFISIEVAAKVLEACPDNEWKLLFALSRFGGLRCPSEHLALTWDDVNWETQRITVRSPKTERHEGKESRVIPLFPELRPYLQTALDELLADFDPGISRLSEQPIIRRYRNKNANLRTQFERILKRAGLKSWPKIFQNLRSTRETELAEDTPIQTVCNWLGNSRAVATKHYLQVTDTHYADAVNRPSTLTQNPVHSGAISSHQEASAVSHERETSQESQKYRESTLNQYPGQDSNLRPWD